jgi:putative ABC transport system substrate-binding protein
MRRNIVGFIVTFALGFLFAPLTASTQSPTKVHHIGWLAPSFPPSEPDWRQAHPFLQGLSELGYIEGQNIVIEYRWAERRFERLPALAAELVRLKVEVIFALGGAAAGAARQATDTIPIVTTAGDPVAQGLVASLARPGGNVTGVSAMNVELGQKRLQIFKEVLSGMSRVAALWCPGSGVGRLRLHETQVASQAQGVQLLPLEVRSSDDFEALFDAATREHVDGLVVLDCPIIPPEIADLAAKHRLPAMYSMRSYVANGGLMSYGPSAPAALRRAAVYVDKILKGSNPADLPVEQPMKFELVINLKTAKALGITMPPSLLLLADEVIQ